MSDKGHVSKKYEHLKLNNKKTNKKNPNKNGQKVEQMLIKDDIEMTNRCMKKVWHHYFLGKSKLKPQWDNTAFLLEWSKELKNMTMSNVSKDADLQEFSFTGRNAIYYNHSSKLLFGFF